MSNVRLDMIDRAINNLGEGTPEYHEALAFYCTIMAKRQWVLADHARRFRERELARNRRAAATEKSP